MTSPDPRYPASPALAVSGVLTRRSYTIRRSTALMGLVLLTATTGWSGATTWYILRKDDIAARLIRRETTRQYAYEDRITALRADIDRLASRALLDQDGVEARVDEIASRQADLESKQALIAGVTEALSSAGINMTQAAKSLPLRQRMIKPSEPVQASSSVSSFAPLDHAKPKPAPDLPPLRGAANKGEVPWQSGEAQIVPPAQRVADTLSQLGRSLTASATAQLDMLREIDGKLGTAQRSLRSALAETGLNTDRLLAAGAVPKDVGGPFVPIKLDPSAGPFEATLHSLQPKITDVVRLRGLVEQLPLRRPMAGSVDMSSNYGYRVDPFTRGPAMHTGIDFRAETGTQVRAAAPGRVVTAEYSGGYGNMVEIEHAGGVTTRYAHMSAISVSEGQTVTSGTVVGRVGTTGRSTGPHLHYETRIDGEAVNPIRFLTAGNKIADQL